MKKNVGYVVALCVWGLFTTASHAQGQNQFGTNTGGGLARPAVSPYLQILRGGNLAYNYYGLTKPQIAAGRALETLGNEFDALEAAANQTAQTGNVTSFQTQGRYFMTRGAFRPGMGRMGQVGQPGQGGQAGGQPTTGR